MIIRDKEVTGYTEDGDYFEYMERHDFSWFEKFVNDTNFFSSCTGMPQYTRHDVEASRGKWVYSIELKNRYAYYSEWYIEPDKLQHLYNEAEIKKQLSYYFVRYDDKLWIYNTKKMKDCNPQVVWVTINNKGKKRRERVQRALLPVSYATVYNLKTKQIEI